MYEPDASGWLERVDWADVVGRDQSSSRGKRADLIYLAWAIASYGARDRPGETVAELPTRPVREP